MVSTRQMKTAVVVAADRVDHTHLPLDPAGDGDEHFVDAAAAGLGGDTVDVEHKDRGTAPSRRVRRRRRCALISFLTRVMAL